MLKVKTLVLNPSNSAKFPSESVFSKTGGASDEKSLILLPSQTKSSGIVDELVKPQVTAASDSPSLPIVPSIAPEKSIFLFPRDSSQFNIPSLSMSKSMLSFTPSESVSGGHALTGILSESRIPSQSSTAPEIW